MLTAAEDVPQVGREPRQSGESRYVSHQLGFKAFLTRLRDSLRPKRARAGPARGRPHLRETGHVSPCYPREAGIWMAFREVPLR
jgi:hypothetical protein